MSTKKLEEELRAAIAERDALRLIVTERFAGQDIVVDPNAAADVARWAAHPDAVRELLKLDPIISRSVHGEYDGSDCVVCEGESQDTDMPVHLQNCTVAAAWRALGDPRGAADIELAHEEALRMDLDRGHCNHEVRDEVAPGHFECVDCHAPVPAAVPRYMT